MALGKHKKTEEGKFRRERGDSLAGNLAEEYPEFRKVPPQTRLDTLRKRFGVGTLDEVRRSLRKAR